MVNLKKENERISIEDSKFVSIDFETANSDRASVCALGITIVDNLKIIEKKYWLIKPHDLYFNPFNVSIHGISKDDVKDKPEFNELWPEIKQYVDKNIVIAHYANFDISVLCHVLNRYEIEYPEFPYFCTWCISKKVWKGLNNYSLNNVADYLSIDFQHHNAEEDAKACSVIAIKACEKLNTIYLKELAKIIELKHSYLNKNEYNPAYCKSNSYSLRVRDIKPETNQFDENTPVFNKSFVFTGTLESTSRKYAMQKVVSTGGICHQTVRENTNFLVAGIQDYRKFRDGKKSNKMREAEDLIARGFDIEIISEDDFLRMFD